MPRLPGCLGTDSATVITHWKSFSLNLGWRVSNFKRTVCKFQATQIHNGELPLHTNALEIVMKIKQTENESCIWGHILETISIHINSQQLSSHGAAVIINTDCADVITAILTVDSL